MTAEPLPEVFLVGESGTVAAGAGPIRCGHDGGVEGPFLADLAGDGIDVKVTGGARCKHGGAARARSVIDPCVVTVANLNSEALGEGGFGDDGLDVVKIIVARVRAGGGVDFGKVEDAAGDLGHFRERDEIAAVLIVDARAVWEEQCQRGPDGDGLRENRVAVVIAILAADLEAFPRLHGGGEMVALGVALETGLEVERVVAHAVYAEGEIFHADLSVHGVTTRALRVTGRGNRHGRAAVEVGAFGCRGDDAAGIARTKEKRIRTADGLDAVDVKRVEQGGVRAQKTVAPRVVNLETAHRHALRVLPVAFDGTADVFVAVTDEGGAEAADLPKHVGHVDRAHVIHQLAVEDLGVERGFIERGIGAGDGIGVGGVVGVRGVVFYLKDGKEDGFFGDRARFGGGGR